MSRHVVEACREAGFARIVVVVGHEAEAVKTGLGSDIEYALQEVQHGTGHAVLSAQPLLSGFEGTVLVVAGDVPLLRAETLAGLLAHHESSGAAATLLTARSDDPTGYGRIVRNERGQVYRIVEHRDATEEERAIKEWNPSIYCFDAWHLFTSLQELRPTNAQGELYLTDVIGILATREERIEAVPVEDNREVLGVNTRVELAEAASIMRSRILTELMLSGVSVTDPSSTYVDAGVKVGQDTVIEPQTYLMGATVIGEDCVIGPMSRIKDSTIGDGSTILSSQVVQSDIGAHVKIGPFSNIRPHCKLADGVKIGDFVELKNAALGEKVSASHLSYIGDAEVGARTNIGAGTVTCNYDGKRKHRTTIGADAFIGTHSTLIAPVSVGEGAYVAAGSPVNEDVPADSLVIARSRPVFKPGWARAKREKDNA